MLHVPNEFALRQHVLRPHYGRKAPAGIVQPRRGSHRLHADTRMFSPMRLPRSRLMLLVLAAPFLGVGMLMIGLFALSMAYSIAYNGPVGGWWLTIHGGRVVLGRSTITSPDAERFVIVRGYSAPRLTPVFSTYRTFQSAPVRYYVNLWAPAFVCILLGAILAWWARKHEGQPLCSFCGYNLTGNTSGKCPECGSSIPIDQKRVIATVTLFMAQDTWTSG